MTPPPLPVALLLATLAGAAQAEMYRWVDEKGTTVYSTTPPPGAEAQRVKPPPRPAEDPDAAQRRVDAQRQSVKDYLEDRELAAQKQSEAKKTRDLAESNCRAARHNLEQLDAGAQRLMQQPDGSYVRLDEEQRQKRMQEARDQIAKHCK